MTTIGKACTTTIKTIVYHIDRPDKFIDLIHFASEPSGTIIYDSEVPTTTTAIPTTKKNVTPKEHFRNIYTFYS